MQLDTKHNVTDFSQSSEGELAGGRHFIAPLAIGQAVHAVRAFRTGERDDPPEYCFVTLGPFGEEQLNEQLAEKPPKGPLVFGASKLHGRSALWLAESVCLRPSLKAEDLQALDVHSPISLVSKIALTEDGAFLGVVQTRGPSWSVVFLNVETGQLTANLSEHGVASSRWSLVMKRDGEAPVTLFEWPADGGTSL